MRILNHACIALALATGLQLPETGLADCRRQYAICFEDASELDSWWSRLVVGAACFAEYVGCSLRTLA